MKIKVDIECTPQEARAFFGLPHLEPMQEALLDKIRQRLSEHLDARDPEALLKLWLPGGLQGLGQMQEQLWRQFLSGLTPGSAPGDKTGKSR